MAAPRVPLTFAAGVMLMGMVLVAIAVLMGEAEVHLVLVFPVISGSGPVIALGAALLILGFILMFLSMASRLETTYLVGPEGAEEGRGPPPDQAGPRPGEAGASRPAPRPRSEFGGVVFIGPVPIVFGSGNRMRGLMLIAAIVIAVLLIVSILAGLL